MEWPLPLPRCLPGLLPHVFFRSLLKCNFNRKSFSNNAISTPPNSSLSIFVSCLIFIYNLQYHHKNTFICLRLSTSGMQTPREQRREGKCPWTHYSISNISLNCNTLELWGRLKWSVCPQRNGQRNTVKEESLPSSLISTFWSLPRGKLELPLKSTSSTYLGPSPALTPSAKESD